RRAVCIARGEKPPEDWTPELRLDLPAYLPSDYIADEAMRVELHDRMARLLRTGDAEGMGLIEDEIEDRFGPLPDPVRNLLALAPLRVLCRRLGVAKLEVGPAAAAATLRSPLAGKPSPPLEQRGERVILARPSGDPAEELGAAKDLLELVAAARSQS
ncbi:MAG: hypothetical protein JO122_14745, partial [Acetobacteraceae bacterium]|nr:hypothetical protein [Acetobacteraceae bacterium]